MTRSELERLLKPKELMVILSLGRSATYRLLATGELPSVIVTSGARKRSFRVRPSDLERWLKQREVGVGR